MSEKRIDPGVIAAQQAREELYDTLGRLRERLDYAERIDRASERTKARLAGVKSENPIGFALGIAGVAVGAGLVVWGIAKKFIKE